MYEILEDIYLYSLIHVVRFKTFNIFDKLYLINQPSMFGVYV